MSDFDATVATAGYRGTKNNQIVHLKKRKGQLRLSQSIKSKGASPR